MGGDDSQKLLPWRGNSLLSRAQTLPFQRSITLPQNAALRPVQARSHSCWLLRGLPARRHRRLASAVPLAPPNWYHSRPPSTAPHIPVFGAQYPACIYPCPTLQVQPHDCPRMARGQDGSLRLSCMTLTFTAPRRFIPTLSAPAGILLCHPADEIADLPGDRRPAASPSGSPAPVQTEAGAVPADDGLGLDDEQDFVPPGPKAVVFVYRPDRPLK